MTWGVSDRESDRSKKGGWQLRSYDVPIHSPPGSRILFGEKGLEGIFDVLRHVKLGRYLVETNKGVTFVDQLKRGWVETMTLCMATDDGVAIYG